MVSPTSAQQRRAVESRRRRQEFEWRMVNMVSRLEMTDTIFFHKKVHKSMATEAVKGPYAYSLEFPLDFLNRHSRKVGLDATFVTTDSHRTWPIKITVRSFKGRKPRVFAYGLGGWKSFLVDNHIKVGDILILKLIRFSYFEVYIGRSPEC